MPQWYDDDRDLPQDIDLDDSSYDDDEVDDTFLCPTCGRELYHGLVKCPYCGEWVTRESVAAERSRGWFWPTVIAILIAVILVMWSGLGRW